jgi:hypothetical protein
MSLKYTNKNRNIFPNKIYYRKNINTTTIIGINNNYIIADTPVGRKFISLKDAIQKNLYNFNNIEKTLTIGENVLYIENDKYENIKEILSTKIEILNPTGPTYSISPSTSSINEGSSVTFTITTTNVANGTTLYWTNSGTSVAGDFSDSINSGSITITNGSGSVSRTLRNDATTEGSETIILQIRTGSTSGTIVATSSTVTIGDTSLTPAGGGSMVFDYNTGVAGTYVRYPNDSNLAIGTSNFTIEWF